MLGKLKNAIYGDISSEEIRKFTLLAITFLFTIGTYWLLRPLKDSLFFDIVGGKHQPLAKMLSVAIIVPLVLIYSKLVDMFEKHVLFYIFGTIYASMYLTIAYLLGHPTIGLDNVVADKYRLLGWFIYIGIESFGSILIALFWSFVASITSTESAKKGFPFVIAGGQIGGVIGPVLGIYSNEIGRQNLFYLAACLPLAMVFMVMYFMKTTPKDQLVSNKADTSAKSKPKTGFFEGLRLLVTRPYLFGIFAIVSLFEIVGTIIDFQMKIQGHQVYGRGEAFLVFLSKFGAATNALALVMALLGTSYMMRRFGLVFCLLAFPITAGVAITSLYFVSISGVTPITMMWSTFSAMFLIKGLSYALNNPSKEMMYIPTSKDAKYKTKGWIDMFGSRSAKATGSVINTPLNKIVSTQGIPAFMMYGAIISLGIVGLWITAALFVGRKFVSLNKEGKIVE